MSTQSSERVTLSIQEARELGRHAIGRLGYANEESAIIVDHLLDAELCGYEYSGLSKILNLAANPRYRQARSQIRVVKETPTSALFDGGHNSGMLAVYRATQVAIEKAKTSGMCIVGIYDAFNSGRNAYYLEMVCKADLVGIHLVSASPQVTVPGGKRPVLGTNPIAFGIPTLGEPILFDMATAALAGSDLMHRERVQQSLPEGVAVDAEGNSTRDAAAARLGGLLTFGGYKGFGLSLCVQMLGLLAGTPSATQQYYGFVLLAIDPAVLVPLADFKRAASELVERVKSTPRRADAGQLRLPSERAFNERSERLAAGTITLDRVVYDALTAYSRAGGSTP